VVVDVIVVETTVVVSSGMVAGPHREGLRRARGVMEQETRIYVALESAVRVELAPRL
jgi:hypothetical protein